MSKRDRHGKKYQRRWDDAARAAQDVAVRDAVSVYGGLGDPDFAAQRVSLDDIPFDPHPIGDPLDVTPPPDALREAAQEWADLCHDYDLNERGQAVMARLRAALTRAAQDVAGRGCTCPLDWTGMSAPLRGHADGCPAQPVTPPPDALREAAQAFVTAHDEQRHFKEDYEFPSDEYAALRAALHAQDVVQSPELEDVLAALSRLGEQTTSRHTWPGLGDE